MFCSIASPKKNTVYLPGITTILHNETREQMTPEQAYEPSTLDTVTTTTETAPSGDSTMGSFDSFFKKLNLSRERWIEIALYTGIGFLVGYLCKRYSYYIFLLVLMIAVIAGLQMLEVISLSVHVDKINEYLGMQLFPQDTDGVTFYLGWAKEHMYAAMSLIVGFGIGVWIA